MYTSNNYIVDYSYICIYAYICTVYTVYTINNYRIYMYRCIYIKRPYSSDGKESACNAGYLGSIPGSGRSPREGNDNPLQYSCLENSMGRGAWWAAVRGVTKSQTQLSG